MSDSSTPPLAREALDRDAGARDDESVFARNARMPGAGAAVGLELRHPSTVSTGLVRAYLGKTLQADGVRDAGSPIEVVVVDDDEAARIEPERARWATLRQAVLHLDDRDAGLFTEAVALANWHDAHAFCPRCGAVSAPSKAGWVRVCSNDGAQQFPRTDAAVIVLITDDADRVLLGSNAMWEQHRYSLLAGFVEPGESLESAVRREIGEEAGIAVDRVRYVASQPWPFPASLMVGFTACAADGIEPESAVADGEEILVLRWFSRGEIAAARDDIALPGPTSIAGWLLERWYGGPLDGGLPWSSS